LSILWKAEGKRTVLSATTSTQRDVATGCDVKTRTEVTTGPADVTGYFDFSLTLGAKLSFRGPGTLTETTAKVIDNDCKDQTGDH
jgi:hypothetical protein